jgi:arabinan endo-1,5-alpha-L-arabinosidase
MISKRLVALLSIVLLAASTAISAANAARFYTNPVIDADFPDPAIIAAPDRSYYAYATQTERDGHWTNIQLARSIDLVHWNLLGDALPKKPAWASRTQDFWAPHVIRSGTRYILYFSAKPDTTLVDPKAGMCLGVATAASPRGPFVDIGHPLRCGASFINIDPMVFDDPATGKRLLYWGSGFEPIRVQQLSRNGLSFAPRSAAIDLVRPNGAKGAFPVLIEGSWIIRHGGWYYLFYSGDNCCGPKADYAVMVARSRHATGPFETLEQATDKPHSIVLAQSAKWRAPGHNSVIADAAGTDWIVYHAVDTARPREKPADDLNTRRILLIDRIDWRAGWPVIDGPSSTARTAPTTAAHRSNLPRRP